MIFLARFWPVFAGLAVIAGLVYAAHVALDRADTRGYQRATAEMAAKVVIANAETDALEQRQRTQSAAAAASWETERDALQTRLNGLLGRPRPVIRLCSQPASGGQVRKVSGTTGSIDDASGGQIDAMPLGDDFGRTFLVRAGTCERYRLQLKGLQDWITTVAQPGRATP